MAKTIWDEPIVKVFEKKSESIACHSCNQETNHKVISSVSFRSSHHLEDAYDNSMDGTTKIEIIQCQGCMSPSTRFSTWNSEEVDYDSHNPKISYEFFPKRDQLIEFSESYQLPTALGDLYSETISAINNNSPTIAGIGIRGLIETICKEENIQGKNLYEKIESLFTAGKISHDSKDILHTLRAVYNKSAHESFKPTKDQLYISLDIIELLLKQLYVHSYLAKKHFPTKE